MRPLPHSNSQAPVADYVHRITGVIERASKYRCTRMTSSSSQANRASFEPMKTKSSGVVHQINFSPSWIWREVVEVAVITPAVGLGIVVAELNTTAFGVAKFARFSRLKNSARN
jgi:hypothetical protein